MEPINCQIYIKWSDKTDYQMTFIAIVIMQHLLNVKWKILNTDSVQFSLLVVFDFCDPMNHSTPGLPVYHQLPEFTETHVHRVSDAIQPSHPLSSPSPPAPNPSQHQSFPMSQLFAWGGQSTGVSALALSCPLFCQPVYFIAFGEGKPDFLSLNIFILLKW